MTRGRGGWRQSWDAWQHDLWTPLKWAHSSHTVCLPHFRAGTLSRSTARGINDPEVTQPPPVYHSHMHFLIMWQFISVCLVSSKPKWAAKASDGHVNHSSVTYFEVRANSESDKEEKEVVPLRDRKNWVKRDRFLQSPASLLFWLQGAELSAEIYSISSRVWMETDFIILCGLNLVLW